MSETEDYLRGARFLHRVNDSNSDDFGRGGEALFDVLERLLPIQEIEPADVQALGRAIREAASWEFK